MSKEKTNEDFYQDIKKIVLDAEAENKIVIFCEDGLLTVDIDKLIKQPTEGLLYDLNRDRVTVLNYIHDKKWVNDFACMKVIEKLKQKLETHKTTT